MFLQRDLFIDFTCSVSSNGLENVPNKRGVFKNRIGSLMQHKPFTIEALKEYLSFPLTSETGSGREDDYQQKRKEFYNSWGFIYSVNGSLNNSSQNIEISSENDATFYTLLRRVRSAEKSRREDNEYSPDITRSIQIDGWTFRHTSDRNIRVPVVKPARLVDALEIAWVFGAYELDRFKWARCARDQAYGYSKDCLGWFIQDPPNKKCCSKKCTRDLNTGRSRNRGKDALK